MLRGWNGLAFRLPPRDQDQSEAECRTDAANTIGLRVLGTLTLVTHSICEHYGERELDPNLTPQFRTQPLCVLGYEQMPGPPDFNCFLNLTLTSYSEMPVGKCPDFFKH